MAKKKQDESRLPSPEVVDGAEPEYLGARRIRPSDEIPLAPTVDPWGGMGVPDAARRPANAAEHMAGAVPPEHAAPNACPADGKRTRRSGKRMESVARKPGGTTLSEIAAHSRAR
jgi:hypothetical protein